MYQESVMPEFQKLIYGRNFSEKEFALVKEAWNAAITAADKALSEKKADSKHRKIVTDLSR